MSVLSLSHHTGKRTSYQKHQSLFLCLYLYTYFLLKLIIEVIESNPGPSYNGKYGIKKAVQILNLRKLQIYSVLTIHILVYSGKQLKLISY